MPRRTLNFEEILETMKDTPVDELTKKAIGLVVVGNVINISSSFYKKLKGKYLITEVYVADNLVSLKKLDLKAKPAQATYWTLIEDTKRFLSEGITYFKIYTPLNVSQKDSKSEELPKRKVPTLEEMLLHVDREVEGEPNNEEFIDEFDEYGEYDDHGDREI